MKKLLILILLCMMVGMGFGVSVIHAETQGQVLGEGTSTEKSSETTTTPIVTTTTTTVEYILPFPGMLPDNPLYFLKRFRDYIMEKLIVDPIKKAQFYILQADKRLGMGLQYADMGKVDTAEPVISKASKYLEQAVTTLEQYKANGGTIPPYVIDTLMRSMKKHSELIIAVELKTSGSLAQGLQDTVVFLGTLEPRISALSQ